VHSISLKRRQAALEFRLHHAIFRDFATGHGDDLEDCSGANCSKYRAVRSTDRETQSEPRSLLVSGKKPEGAAVVAANFTGISARWKVNALFVNGKTIKPAARAFADFLLRELRAA
jgi:hypothetical protein